MLYTVAKQVGAMYVTLRGQVDAIIPVSYTHLDVYKRQR